MNTLQELLNRIELFCNNSPVINEFNDTEFTGEFKSDNHKYPLLWVTPTKMRIVNGQISFIIQLTVADVMYEKSDLIKTLSDLSITLSELMTYLDDDSETFYYYVTINSEFEPFSQGIDNSTGWTGQIEMRLSFGADNSDIRSK